MSLKEIKDKLEIGLKPDAPYRPNNLPDNEALEQEEALVEEFQRPDPDADDDSGDRADTPRDTPRRPTR